MSVLELNGRVFDASTTGTLTLTGEGSATTDVTQGLAKCWMRMTGSGTPAINDSLNITSLTDQATGNFRVAIANDMSSRFYSATTAAGGSSSNNTLANCATPDDVFLAGSIDLDLQYAHQTADDLDAISLTTHGDLA